jgi:hypothetical protein
MGRRPVLENKLSKEETEALSSTARTGFFPEHKED